MGAVMNGSLPWVMRLLRRVAMDWVFPRTCRVCGRTLVAGADLMCVGCVADLPRTGLHGVDFNTVHQRIGGTHPVGMAAGWFYYYPDSGYANLIREAKYGDRPATGRKLGEMYGRELMGSGVRAVGEIDVLLPVPLHYTKLWRRGYNQSREIAVGLASVMGCAVGDNLVALRRHATQTRRGGLARYENVRGSFGLRHGEELEGLSVAIVDDIITTGATVHECVAAVAAAGPAEIHVLSIGITHLR